MRVWVCFDCSNISRISIILNWNTHFGFGHSRLLVEFHVRWEHNNNFPSKDRVTVRPRLVEKTLEWKNCLGSTTQDRTVFRNRKASFLRRWNEKKCMTVDKRKGLDFTRVLWHFASFKLQSETVDTSAPNTKQAPLSLSLSFFHLAGGRIEAKKKKSKRLRATMETRNSFAVRRRGLLPANSLIAAFLRVFLPLCSPPWPFCDGNGPRLASVITVRIPDSPFRAHAAVRAQKRLGKVEPSFSIKLSKPVRKLNQYCIKMTNTRKEMRQRCKYIK